MEWLRTLGLHLKSIFSLEASSELRERADREFFAGHDHEAVITTYDPNIDRILAVSTEYSIVDHDARRAIGIMDATFRDLQGVHARGRDTARIALDHVVASDRRWMYNFDVPLQPVQDTPAGYFEEVPFEERWIATHSAPRGQLLGVPYWVLFFRGMNNHFNWAYNAYQGEILGTYCKRCDAHYQQDMIISSVERGHRSMVQMQRCPKRHYV